MRQLFFHSLHNGGFHRIAYTEWGDAANPHVVVCVHGLARNSRDFDYLADALSADCRVVCMDVVGRGESDWLENKSDYTFSTYQADAASMLARATATTGPKWFGKDAPITKLDWVGTSMGGMIGMFLAAKRNTPIRRLVLNDVGALIPWGALFRMKGYVGHGVRYPSLERVEAHLRDVCAPFGPLTDKQWHHLTEHSARRDADGSFLMRYDPAIAQGGHDREFPMGPDVLRGIDLWNVWSKVACPTLVMRGADSDVLRPATLREMKERKPDLESVEFAGVGHAPALMSADQISAVRRFLLR
jgi:pimeloyl-ACP methyl ester carboxylesterase